MKRRLAIMKSLNGVLNKTGQLGVDNLMRPANSNKTRATNRTKPKKRKK